MAWRVPLKCSQQQKGLFFHPKQMEILAGGQKQILCRGWSISDSPTELWDPGDSQLSAVSIFPRGAGSGGVPSVHGKTRDCLGAGRVCEKELRACREGLLSQANLRLIPAAPTYLESVPLRASVYLSAKWDNKGYLGGVWRR